MQSPSTSSGVERLPRITLNEYFMGIAILSAKKSEKGCYPVGACIVNSDQTIVATGYNTIHKACNKKKDDRSLFVCHAEVAAILNKPSRDDKGCTMYVTRFPCKHCANRIISSGIKEVIYCNMELNYSYTTKSMRTAKEIFATNGVVYKECTTIYNKLVPEAYNRFSRLTNEECFMAIAYLSSQLRENVEKIGACIVNNDNIIVGVGYNGFSRKMVCYADFIINTIQSASCDIKGCTVYVTSFPCNESAKVIAGSGIKTVMYLYTNIDDKTEAAKKMFDADNVKYIKYNVAISKIEIFRSIITSKTATKVIKERQKEEETKKIEGEKKKKKKNKKTTKQATNKIKSESATNLNTVEVIKEKQIKTINNSGEVVQTVQYLRGSTGGILAASFCSTKCWDQKSGAVLVIDTASILEFNINTASMRRLF